jgi:flagellar protein FlaJ
VVPTVDLFSLKKEKKKDTMPEDITADEIVKKVLEKYQEEGFYREEDETPEAVKEILAVRTITSQASIPLESHPSPIVRFLGRLHDAMEGIVERIQNRLVNLKLLRKIDFELYSANIKLTASQYVGISITLALLIGILTTILIPIYWRSLLTVISAPVAGIVAFFLTFVLALWYPAQKAKARGDAIEKELPFALRHLAVVIRSGMSLYNAMESIASANYGVLSEEFKRTLKEISEGKTTEEALEALALRSHSRAMRRTVSQILRSLRIGGKLSDAIRRIAEDVAFEQRNRVVAFTEKLNLVGIVFMYAGVVFPTMLAILNTIGNAPLSTNLLASFALSGGALMGLYLLGVPLFLFIIMLFVKLSDPLGG